MNANDCEFDLSVRTEAQKEDDKHETGDASSVSGDEGELATKRRRRQCDIVWTQVYQSEKDGFIYCAQCDTRIRVPGLKRKVEKVRNHFLRYCPKCPFTPDQLVTHSRASIEKATEPIVTKIAARPTNKSVFYPLPSFSLEEFFAEHEFTTKYLMCCSDMAPLTQAELLRYADPECMNLWNNLSLGYTESSGHPLLKKEIAKLYDTTADHVHCFAGAEEGIYATMRSLLRPRDHVVVITPCYQSLQSIANTICVTTCVDLLETAEGWRIDIPFLRQWILDNTKMIIMNFPHNPTGAVPSREDFDAVVALAREHNLYLFCDEVYHGLEKSPSLTLPFGSTVYEKAISLGVISKSYGLAGLRIGWLVSQDTEALDRIAKYKHYLSICNSAPSEILCLIALRAREQILRNNRQVIDSNLALFTSFLSRYPTHFSWHVPAGGCCGFVKLRSGQDAKAFAHAMATQEQILVLPGSFYPTNTLGCDAYFRVGFGRKDFPQALIAFERCMMKYLNVSPLDLVTMSEVATTTTV